MDEPYNAIFQHTHLPDVLRIGEYQGYYYLPTEPIKSAKAGILEINKLKDEIINSDDIIYRIHFDVMLGRF